MHRLIGAVFTLLLAACAAKAPVLVGAHRNPAHPIYSSAVLDPARLEGRWVQVAAFAQPGAGACAPGGVEITRGQGGLRAGLEFCFAGQRQRASGALVPAGPGRFRLDGAARPGLGEDWWVLWADADYRTLVIGTPSGQFGFILNRQAVLPADRLMAAREILDFNGYDLAQLQVFAR